MRVTYNAEYERRIRVGFIGCGGHAHRNILPTLQYAPVDLVATCDLDADRAASAARLFGASSHYTDYRRMLDHEDLDAAFVVTDYDEDGRPRYPGIAIDCMQAGVHAWIEKPPAAGSDEIRQMMAVSAETGKFVGVGFKKMFFPANVKAKELVDDPEFGDVSSVTARYPQRLPPYRDRADDRAMLGFLDHVMHPYSVLLYLAGSIDSVFVRYNESVGSSVTAVEFASGAVGSLHLSHGQSPNAPFERTDVVGQGRGVVVDNNVRVTCYRSGEEGPAYGRESTFYGADDTGALTWEPEFSLGQLYNKGIFLLGYAPEVLHFCDCVLKNSAPEVAGLEHALEILKIYEAYRGPDGQVVRIPRG